MSSLRPESHVAQQIRRDKLRVQQLQDFPNNLEQLSLHPGLNPDLVQVRNVRNANMLYGPAFYSSEMANFSSTLNPLSANRDAMACQELGTAETSRLMMPQFSEPFPHSSGHLASSSVHASSKVEEFAPRNFGNWRNTGSNQGYDWMVNYATSSVSNETIPNSLVVAELNNVSAYQQYAKPSYNELNDVQCSLSNISMAKGNRESQRHLGGMHTPPPPPLYHNTLQDIVKSASISAQGSDMASVMPQTGHGIWVGNGNELVLLPSYGNQSNQLRFGNANSSWTNRTSDDSLISWHSPLGFTAKRSEQDSGPVLSDSNPQGLSLSLSSNANSKLSVSQFGEGCGSDDLQSRCGISKDPQYCKSEKSMLKPSIISKDSGKSIQDIAGIPSNHRYRNVGPLGPFTGYATILKSSRFIRPAQQLLDELCCFSGPNLTKACDVSERISGEVSASTSAEAFNAPESGIGAKGCTSGAPSSSKFYSSNENSSDGGAGSNFCMSSWPDCQQKRAKLLYMQDEVTRRYKQYHQQMQMVVSSFESVAGLSSATPYISMALKSVSRQFRCLKNAITDQLKHIREMLGEDLSAPSSGTGSKLDNNAARLRYMDQSFQKNKSSGGNVAFLEPQQHVWRPQRGLPDRSVAILRAWLFEHFLHPYPTDTDKHMLATQTGLSRNQVSNWFINARVRVWKPMVEEIHTLETKGLTGTNHNLSKNEGTSATEGPSQPRVDQSLNKFGTHTIPETQLDCLEMGSYAGARDEEGLNAEQWNQEKRSKLECEITSSMDGTLIGFMPYRRGGIEVGGLGSVSLTLGLRHGVDGAQQQQHKLQQEDQLRQHFGGQMIHDFVG